MKKYNLAISFFSLLGIVAGYCIVFPDKVGLCKIQDNGCIYNFPVFTLGQPLFLLSISFFITSLFLFFAREEVFKTWGKFALGFLPLTILLIWISPTISNDLITPFDKKLTATFLSVLFFLISLVIIAVKSWKLRKASQNHV